eukprot:6209446-Pleurochrysis_carterae.AAC.1
MELAVHAFFNARRIKEENVWKACPELPRVNSSPARAHRIHGYMDTWIHGYVERASKHAPLNESKQTEDGRVHPSAMRSMLTPFTVRSASACGSYVVLLNRVVRACECVHARTCDR